MIYIALTILIPIVILLGIVKLKRRKLSKKEIKWLEDNADVRGELTFYPEILNQRQANYLDNCRKDK